MPEITLISPADLLLNAANPAFRHQTSGNVTRCEALLATWEPSLWRWRTISLFMV